MFKILRKPYAVGLSAMNLLVRLAGGAVALALVLFVQESRGSFAAAGFVAGCFAVGTACGAPVTGRLVDRVGATRVLLVTAAVHAGALLAIAGLPRVPLGVVAGIAVLGGAARPPVGAWMRGIWVAMLEDERERRASYRFESALLEIGFIAGPLIAGLVAALGRPALGLVLTAAIAGGATVVFALLPPSRAASRSDSGSRDGSDSSDRAGRTTAPVQRRRSVKRAGQVEAMTRRKGAVAERRARVDVLGALRARAIRVLVVSRTAIGVTLGALQVAAAGFAEGHGRAGFAGVLLGACAFGSLVGAGVMRMRPVVLVGFMGVALVPLLLPVGLWWLAVLFAVAGAPVAPLNAVAYEVTERAALAGTVTEARMWTSTATMAGNALGTAVAGVVIEHWSARAAVGVGIAGALVAFVVDAVGRIGSATEAAAAAGADALGQQGEVGHPVEIKDEVRVKVVDHAEIKDSVEVGD
ncbi:MFS transporter [Dactylosporangium darangshiense]|uniref:MFS transporter n=1 Tax=Dactylosporangium darangshiense TaxID=579108 RepID=A0ABP8DGY9_9ACTN